MRKNLTLILFFCLLFFAITPSCKDEKEDSSQKITEVYIDSFAIENVDFIVRNDTFIGYTSKNIDLSNLIPTFTTNANVFVNDVLQTSGITANDFSQPVTYIVASKNRQIQRKYTIIIDIDKSAIHIDSFEIGSIKFKISGDSIVGYYKQNIDVTKATPTFWATGEVEVNDVLQKSGETPVDLSMPQTYIVYSSNRKICKKYTVILQTFTKIPQIFIYTGGVKIDSKEHFEDAEIKVNPNATITDLPQQKYKGKVRLRGNSTLYYPKSSFKIKFDEDVPLLGMHAYDEWCLIANYPDKTLLRNWLAYEMAARLGMPFVPTHRFVEVYVNGKHQGNYLLTDQVEIGETRVNIPKLKKSSSNITGGYLMEADYRAKEEADAIWWESYGMPISLKQPKEPTAEQLKYISTFVQNADSLIMAGDTKGLKYFDYESTTQWFLINELFKNCDASGFASIFFYKNADDDKLYMSPAWDFDIGAGNAAHNAKAGTLTTSDWYVRYWARIARLHDTGYNTWWKYTVTYWIANRQKLRDVIEMIDPLVETYKLSIDENNKLWPDMQEPSGFVVQGNTTYQMQIDYLKNFLNKRYDWLNTKFESY